MQQFRVVEGEEDLYFGFCVALQVEQTVFLNSL
jgi:hypothetical protein